MERPFGNGLDNLNMILISADSILACVVGTHTIHTTKTIISGNSTSAPSARQSSLLIFANYSTWLEFTARKFYCRRRWWWNWIGIYDTCKRIFSSEHCYSRSFTSGWVRYRHANPLCIVECILIVLQIWKREMPRSLSSSQVKFEGKKTFDQISLTYLTQV